MKQKITLIFCIFIFWFLSGDAQKWLWGEEGYGYSDNYGVAADNSGNAYLAGTIYKSIQLGNQSLSSYFQDAFLVKYNANGNINWVKQSVSLDSNSYCMGIYICTDNQENIYYTGYFYGSVCFGKDTLNATIAGGGQDIFLVKYDSTGKVLWAKQTINYGVLYAFYTGVAIAIDASKNIFLTGPFSDSISFGNYMLHSNSNPNVFLVKYDSNGNARWARQSISKNYYIGASPSSVCVDDSGNPYITGYFEDTVLFGATVLSSYIYDAFLVKYDRNGNIRWVTQSNSTSSLFYCSAYSVITDAAGNVYLTGSANGTVAFGPDTLINNVYNITSGQLFLVKYNSAGKVIWAKQTQGSGVVGYCFAKDTMNQLYLSGGGSEFGKQFFTVIYDNDTLNLGNFPNDPSIIYKLDTAGNLLCSSIICTGGDDNNGIACSSAGQFVYLGGDIYDTLTLGNNFLDNSSQENPFIARWQPCCSAPVSLTGKSSLCKGSGAVLRTSGGGSYLWNTGSTNDSITINPDTTTTYSVSIENAGCAYTLSKTVAINPVPVVTLCCDTIIRTGENVQLSSGGGGSYSWTPNISLSCDTCPNPIATPAQTTTYTLTVISDSGCVSTQTITIDVTIDVPCGDVFIPDIFSPNQSINNILYVRGPCISALDFKVFDRWGNKVFETENKNDGWDGTYNGQATNTATYVYYAKATMYDGSVVEKKGSVTLVR